MKHQKMLYLKRKKIFFEKIVSMGATKLVVVLRLDVCKIMDVVSFS